MTIYESTSVAIDLWTDNRKTTNKPAITIAQWYGWRLPPSTNVSEMGVRAKLRAIYTCEVGYVGLYVDE
jgi:hypothetical protein